MEKQKSGTVTHPIAPVYDKNSVILILGSFPSVKSREEEFFYGHPQNRFWQVMSRIFDVAFASDASESNTVQNGFSSGFVTSTEASFAALETLFIPATIAEKRTFLIEHRVALWDVIAECDICGSSDTSIKNVRANDIRLILRSCDIRSVFVNGKTAEKFYKRYTEPLCGREAVLLPSTSPANAAWTTDRLTDAWKQAITPCFSD